ncbi:hypothetical protein DCAR_0104241 [Daucus carota subsp. sativus]|uniref:Uncharacterized protein n=1 Tax=Daucus carota subsp. sativus TaxID=79200 RepID=A0A166INQ9_DAUCS|nr:PREDICTED: zinc finger protein GIS-like [Daucus carota subsp. sativus]WOG85055.1 hypothetical protein DCAR_0104241 [Daucus carota subsp. sativus]
MDAQKVQHSPSSNSPPRRNEIDAPALTQIPKNSPEPKTAKTYPCRYCDKTFSTFMALGGHQNGHKRARGLHAGRAQTPLYRPYPATSRPNSGSDSMDNKKSNLSMESSTSSTSTWRLLQEFYAKFSVKSAPPSLNCVPPAATALSPGVSSTPKTSEEVKEEDASGLDLDLKL